MRRKFHVLIIFCTISTYSVIGRFRFCPLSFSVGPISIERHFETNTSKLNLPLLRHAQNCQFFGECSECAQNFDCLYVVTSSSDEINVTKITVQLLLLLPENFQFCAPNKKIKFNFMDLL